jgi:hypothetical protein
MKRKKRKILLVEFQPEKKAEVKEFLDNPNEKVQIAKGLKIKKIYDTKGNLLTEYNPKEDRTDLSCLEGKNGWKLCFVNRNTYGKLFWSCIEIEGTLEKSKYYKTGPVRDCTSEECRILNKIYPGYFEEAVNNFNNKGSLE